MATLGPLYPVDCATVCLPIHTDTDGVPAAADLEAFDAAVKATLERLGLAIRQLTFTDVAIRDGIIVKSCHITVMGYIPTGDLND